MAGAKPIEIESFGFMYTMMQMIHTAGPTLTPVNIFNGMQAVPAVLPTKISAGFDYAAPDPFVPQRDVDEVWWNPNLHSYYSNSQGAMCHINNARRYSLGQWPHTEAKLFTGDASCARLP